MEQLTSQAWIDRFLATDPPRSKSLVMTIFGDAIAPHGARLWLGSLIELVATMGVTDRLVRTSVFRLAQEGWLVANREGRRSSYALLPEAGPRLARANRRIYAPPGLDWDGRWTLVMAPNGSISADLRAAVRKELEWEGYAMLAPGLLVHPAADVEALAEILARIKADGRVFACSAAELPGAGSRPLAELVREGWDLSRVVADCRRFIDEFTPLLDQLRADATLTPQAAFVIRSLLIHAYRRVQLHDPMLPLALLPRPWPGSEAYALAQAIYRLTWERAEDYLMDVLEREDAEAPAADAAFYERFGGLRQAGPPPETGYHAGLTTQQ